MDVSSLIHVLVGARLPSIVRYRENLARDSKLKVTVVTSIEAVRDTLNDPAKHTDVLVIDNGLGNVFDLIRELRQAHPRLLILLVDEEADFGMPGRADDVSTEPFKDDELLRKIKRLAEERRLETLRADALPPIRNFAKVLRKATRGLGKQQAAVAAIKDLGYDHVAFYSVEQGDPPALVMGAQVGPSAVMAAMPQRSDYTGILGWVAQHGQSRVIGPGDSPTHFLIEKGRYATAIVVPVGTTMRFGVLLAFQEKPGAVQQDSVIVLELVSAQLASALARETRT